MKKPASIGIRQRAAALLIVLAFLVLLSVIAVSYLSRTSTDRQLAHGTFNGNRADILARGSLDLVIGDLRQEIVNGSTASTVNGYTTYTPTSNANMLPMQSGTPSPTPTPSSNMVRRSLRSDSISLPAIGSRGSAANSTTDISLNGRSVTASRWNKHYLIPRLNAGSTSVDSTPVASFTAPDWVLVTRAGPTPFPSWNAAAKDATSTNTTYVVGRYAYAIYDEGGLLDANVAGFPSPSSSPPTYVQAIGRKGSLAYADLTSLPTSSASPAPTFPPAQVNNIVGWRNYASVQPGGDLSSAFTFSSTNATNFMTFVNNNTGFLTVSSTPYNGGMDQAFASRQELLAFRTQTGFSQNALQYLGTFSRELNRPTYKPATTSAINPNLNAVRVAAAFTRADGTPAVVGEPLMKQRFALTRLRGLSSSGVVTSGNSTLVNGLFSPASAATVQRDFGLAWDNTNFRWSYYGATGSAVQSSIETLSQVASENREPNFFEVLKAAILNGSVGLSSTGNTLVVAEAKYANADYQIMQIGANIIDAWDGDNTPTFINFGGSELAGIENLPYLNKIVLDFWSSNNGNGGAHDQVYAWLVPSLWNPSQNASDPNKATGDVRFAMTGGSANIAITFNNGDPPIVGIPVPKATPYPYIQVRASAFTTACPPVPSPSPTPASASPLNNEASPTPGVTPKIGQLSVTIKDTRLYDGLDFGNPIQTTRNNAWKIIDKVFPFFGSGTNFEMQVPIVVSAATTSPPAPSPIASPTPSHPAPFVTNNPGDQSVLVGQTATFSVTAVTNPGPGSFTFQWTKDGVPITGATVSTYTTPPATFIDNGSLFAVTVTNGSGSVTSNNAALHVVDTTKWKAYQTWSNCYNGPTPAPSAIPPYNGAPINYNSNGNYKNNSDQDPEFVMLDPRTLRFGVWGSNANDTGNSNGYDLGGEDTMDQRASAGGLESVSVMKPQPPATFPMSSPKGLGYLYAVNSSATPTSDSYIDLDLVKRRGDWTTDTNGNTTAKMIMYASASPTPSASASPTPKNSQDRPPVLSQPFQSVAELGTVFRDQPWKTLNFSTTNSGDAGLLDTFTLQDAGMTAGRTSLNTRQSAVLKAIVSQATKNWAAGQAVGSSGTNAAVTLSSADISTITQRIAAYTLSTPLINKADLVTKLMEDSTIAAVFANASGTNPYNKETRESIIRALCDSTQTRTWNLMIDLIAQSGRYPSSATGLANFLVEGEKRYWLHVAIDRFTGEIIDQQLEAVYE